MKRIDGLLQERVLFEHGLSLRFATLKEGHQGAIAQRDVFRRRLLEAKLDDDQVLILRSRRRQVNLVLRRMNAYLSVVLVCERELLDDFVVSQADDVEACRLFVQANQYVDGSVLVLDDLHVDDLAFRVYLGAGQV